MIQLYHLQKMCKHAFLFLFDSFNLTSLSMVNRIIHKFIQHLPGD